MSYKGDSTGKKIARAVFWLRAVRRARALGHAERFAYLASREGGDAAVLCALGVPYERQLAIDRDADALREFSSKHQGVETERGDAAEVLLRRARRREQFAVVFLDFCGPLAGGVVCRCAIGWAAAVRQNGLCAIGAMRGRETTTARGDLRFVGNQVRSAGRKFHPGWGEAACDEDGARAAGDRAALVTVAANAALYKYRRMVVPNVAIAYHSRGDDGSGGVPMVIVGQVLDNLGRGTDRRRFGELYRRALERLDAAQARYAPSAGELHAVLDEPVLVADFHGVNRAYLASFSHQVAQLTADTAGLFNMTQPQLAALRAHATRGSYGPEETPPLLGCTARRSA